MPELPEDIQPNDPGHIAHHDVIHSLLDRLDNQTGPPYDFVAAGYKIGTLAAIPAADATNENFYYFAYDTHQFFVSYGNAWVEVGGDSVLFNVLDYGAVGDGVTDDGSAIQAATDAANAAGGADPHGGIVVFPTTDTNVYLTNQQLFIPNRTSWLGQGSLVTQLKAGPSFPANTALVSMTDPTTLPQGVFSTRLMDMWLEADGIARDGVYSDQLQEASGVFRCTISGVLRYGVHLETSKAQNFGLEHLNISSHPTAVSPRGIYFGPGVDSCNSIRNCTIAPIGTPNGVAIYLESFPTISLDTIHIEQAAVGILCKAVSGAVISNIFGHGSVVDLIRLELADIAITLENIVGGGATNLVNDTVAGGLGVIPTAVYDRIGFLTTGPDIHRQVYVKALIAGPAPNNPPPINNAQAAFRNPDDNAYGFDINMYNSSSQPNAGIGWMRLLGAAGSGPVLNAGDSGDPVGIAYDQGDAIIGGLLPTQKVGFFGAAGTTIPTITGVKATNTALGSLISALAALGLIEDATLP